MMKAGYTGALPKPPPNFGSRPTPLAFMDVMVPTPLQKRVSPAKAQTWSSRPTYPMFGHNPKDILREAFPPKMGDQPNETVEETKRRVSSPRSRTWASPPTYPMFGQNPKDILREAFFPAQMGVQTDQPNETVAAKVEQEIAFTWLVDAAVQTDMPWEMPKETTTTSTVTVACSVGGESVAPPVVQVGVHTEVVPVASVDDSVASVDDSVKDSVPSVKDSAPGGVVVEPVAAEVAKAVPSARKRKRVYQLPNAREAVAKCKGLNPSLWGKSN